MTPPLSSCIINQFATTEHLDGETENFCITCLWCGKKLEVKVQSLGFMTLLVFTGFDFCLFIPTLRDNLKVVKTFYFAFFFKLKVIMCRVQFVEYFFKFWHVFQNIGILLKFFLKSV